MDFLGELKGEGGGELCGDDIGEKLAKVGRLGEVNCVMFLSIEVNAGIVKDKSMNFDPAISTMTDILTPTRETNTTFPPYVIKPMTSPSFIHDILEIIQSLLVSLL